MATSSFDKTFRLEKPKDIERFIDILADERPKPPIETESVEMELKRGKELLKQYLSH